ncbi:MAG TPA: hypothetical protein VL285_04885 [Bryobacteraceae bacterium]|nr:hypothetical protein [Bryobacteraceae bacterium]
MRDISAQSKKELLMACNLRRDPTGSCDFLGTSGQTVRITVKGLAPAVIFRASLNGTMLALSADRISTTLLIPAGGCAFVIQVTAAPGDRVDILEDCGGGQSQVLAQATAADPILGITICA